MLFSLAADVLENYLYNNAPKDGSAIALFMAGSLFEPLFGNSQARYDPAKINWLISLNRLVNIGIFWHTAPIKSADDFFQREVVLASSGGGDSSTEVIPKLLNHLAGTRFKVIAGYSGNGEGMLAMERGEVGGVVGITWASVKATNGSWLRDDKIRPFVQFGLKKHPELPDVSWIYDYARNDDDRAAMDLAFGNSEFGRPFIAPPGVPDQVVDILRDAFEDTMNDPEFRADAEKRQLDLEIPRGAEIQSLIERIYKTPPAVVERVKKIVQSAE